MTIKINPLLILLCLLFGHEAIAQQNLIYNHYYINPFLYNPSFIAPTGYSELYLNYRKQWVGFEGAPQTATMNLQLPLNYKSGLAFTGYQDEAGVIATTTGLVSFSYQVFLGQKILDLHKIGFGISAGYTSSRIKSDDSDIVDPVLANNTSSLDGQFGMHYQYNSFKLAFAIPRLFENNIAAEDEFTHKGISQIENTISSISYDFRLGPSVSLEPVITYRTFENLDDQYEALASLKFTNIGWIGGAYRQDYGAFAFLGANIKEKIKIGYAYEFATEQTDKIGYGSHEVQLVLRLGKKQFTRPQAVSKTQPATATEIEKAVARQEPEQHDEDREPQDQEPQDQEPLDQEHEIVDTKSPDTKTALPVRPEDNTEQIAEVRTIERTREPETKSEPVPTVTKLNGQSLAPGHYVVVGAFRSLQNALDYTATLKRAGYPAHIAFQEERNYYIVHMLNASTIEEARIQRDKYRQMSRYSFRDTWILSIE